MQKQPGWVMQSLCKRGMEIQVFFAEPGASFPVHKSAYEWKGLLIEGKMLLELYDINKKHSKTVKCEPVDRFIFGRNVYHSWQNNGKTTTRMVFIRRG